MGGVSQDATEEIFKDYFAQYGRVIDATLMMDKDTGRPRGFGFVTFDSESAVDKTLNGDLNILGKPIEVKKAQPRGDMSEGVSDFGGRNRGRGGRRGGFGDRGDYGGSSYNPGNMYQQGNRNAMNSMTPQMMAQYMARMQQLVQMQQQFAMSGGATANPAMVQQMQQMMMQQQQQQMQMKMDQQQGHDYRNPPRAAGYAPDGGDSYYPRHMSGGRDGDRPEYEDHDRRGHRDDNGSYEDHDVRSQREGHYRGGGRGRARSGYESNPQAAMSATPYSGPKQNVRPAPLPGRGRGVARGFHPYSR